MTQRPLTPFIRRSAVLGGAVLITLMSLAVLSVVSRWRSEPQLVHLFAIIGLSGVLALGTVLITIGRRGVFDRRRDNHLFAGIALAMIGGLGMGLVKQGLNEADPHSTFAGSVLLALGGLFFVIHLLEQQHITTLEKLDALERRLDAPG